VNADLEAQAQALIAKNAAAVKPVALTGVGSGVVMTSPPAIRQFKELRRGSHWMYSIKPLAKAEQIASFDYGIYRGKEVFPDACCECMAPADHVELMEAAISVRQISNKVRVQASQDEASRLFTALLSHRIWYAIPFCARHGLADKSISMASTGVQNEQVPAERTVVVNISNPEFGRRFRELNGLGGAWVQRTPVGNVNMHDSKDLDDLPRNWLLGLAAKRRARGLCGHAGVVHRVRQGFSGYCRVHRLRGAGLRRRQRGRLPQEGRSDSTGGGLRSEDPSALRARIALAALPDAVGDGAPPVSSAEKAKSGPFHIVRRLRAARDAMALSASPGGRFAVQ
jgi:hypothetical protein